MANTAYQPIGTDIFNATNIKACEKYVSSIQRKLDKAVADNNKSNIRWYTHLLSHKSRAVKILAVYRVTSLNQGKYTAGTDGVKLVKGRSRENEELRVVFLKEINIKKKPSPIKRVFIPKSNGKLRPLGIPTIADRINQDILRTAIEPITEYHASDNSYGFRPKRNCQDATEHLFNKLSKKGSKQWVIEGDIRGCFDNISHEHIVNTLKSWDVKRNIINIIERMLKAEILLKDTTQETDMGTPQGGILSPMLANVALTALDDYCQKHFGIPTNRNKKQGGNYIQNPLVRYADDFVIVCKSKVEAEFIKEKIATFLYEKIGLELSDEKTRITHISDGFDFLGFNIRKHGQKSPKSKYHEIGILLIEPQKEKVVKLTRKIKEILDNNKTAKQESIMRILNPIIQGYGMYNRFVVSKKTFSSIDSTAWQSLWKWAKRRHPKKSKRWIMRKYFTTTGRKWMFKNEMGNNILNMASIPIVRFVMIKSGMRVHANDSMTREYWQERVYTNALSQVYSIKIGKLMKTQRGICPTCGQPITEDDVTKERAHAHHMLPRSKGGSEWLNNLRLLHQNCHVSAHQVLTRDEMASWMKKRLNYILKTNIVHFQKLLRKHPKSKI
ncbi:MAG: group II intron reverse transcriptase/maturase [Candidatus Bathyarchaeum sp.]|nr:MAG: group II intron reverse transcriptase/maturase [Candidatus Bathyarchaeum sp.]